MSIKGLGIVTGPGAGKVSNPAISFLVSIGGTNEGWRIAGWFEAYFRIG
ncbi:MAG: hypothetical protein OEO83_07790 [Alphaproteobacteria bacterium]|nr:hypothetical protein [Alphaproteobacteria bacterium]